MKRALAIAVLLLLPTGAWADDTGDAVDTARQRCDGAYQRANS